MTGDINMNNNKIENLPTPTVNGDAATKKYVDDNKVDGSVFLKLDGSRLMSGNLNMDNNRIFHLPLPTGSKQPTTLGFASNKYLSLNGTAPILNNLNMDNNSIIHLRPPVSDTDAATKKNVDDASPDLSSYLKKDGTIPMTGDLNVGGHKITNLRTPASNDEPATKYYVDTPLHQSQVQPSLYKDHFSYLMSSSNQWTDEIDGGNSFNITKIGDLLPNKGNFHDYNHKVLYMTINKNSQGGYSGAPRARSGAPWVRKFGKLSIRENLVMT